MAITIELTQENETLLSEKAAQVGKTVPEYVRELLRPHMTPPIDFAKIVKPLHDAFEQGGQNEEELNELIHQVRRDIRAERERAS